MKIKTFTAAEKEALLDLMISGMYSDRHIAAAEDARISALLDQLGFATDYDREQALDAAFARARQRLPGSEDGSASITRLAAAFSSAGHRRQACEALEELLGSDQQVTESERKFLDQVRTIFGSV